MERACHPAARRRRRRLRELPGYPLPDRHELRELRLGVRHGRVQLVVLLLEASEVLRGRGERIEARPVSGGLFSFRASCTTGCGSTRSTEGRAASSEGGRASCRLLFSSCRAFRSCSDFPRRRCSSCRRQDIRNLRDRPGAPAVGALVTDPWPAEFRREQHTGIRKRTASWSTTRCISPLAWNTSRRSSSRSCARRLFSSSNAAFCARSSPCACSRCLWSDAACCAASSFDLRGVQSKTRSGAAAVGKSGTMLGAARERERAGEKAGGGQGRRASARRSAATRGHRPAAPPLSPPRQVCSSPRPTA